MTVSVRALPTAFDPPAGQVTVATPSCCCCCCCLNATLGVTSFMASEAYYQAEERDRSTWLPLTLGLLAVPLGIILIVAMAQLESVDWGFILVGAGMLSAVMFGLGLATAGVDGGRALGIAAAVGAIGIGAFFVELVGALFTVLIIELLCPLSAWGGWAIARGRHRRRAPDAFAWRGPEPAYPPIPGRAAPPGTGWPPTGGPPPPSGPPPGALPPPGAPPTGGPPPSTEEW